MLTELNRYFLKIERQKSEMIGYVQGLSEAMRNERATPSEWSALQILEHVIVVEEWMAGVGVPELTADSKVLLKGHMFIIFGGTLMRSGLRVPTLPEAAPHAELDFAVLINRWEQAREKLFAKLEAVTTETLPSAISMHPVVGPLNAKQALLLLDAHLDYHTRYMPRYKAEFVLN